MAMEDYTKALRAGQKCYRSMISEGAYPYLHVLDEMIADVPVAAENNLGVVEIPVDMIAGTKTVGRRNAFARNFMPLLDSKTEFAAKWALLYDSLAEEGVNDPIKAYEYMGHFYVQEGNKRVSVMKALGAVSIPGVVIRMIPEKSDDPLNRIYYEFLDFYKITGVNYLTFTTEGGYAKLIEKLPYSPVKWSNDDSSDFRSVYAIFSKMFYECGGSKLNGVTPADALVRYLEIYGFETLHAQTSTEIKAALNKMWLELIALQPDEEAALSMQPTETKKSTGILSPSKGKQVSVAFICDRNADNSSWNYGHELGRRYLEQTFSSKQVVTKLYDNTDLEKVGARIDQAVADGNNVIFTTTPLFLNQTLKAALQYPNVKFLNCSLNTNHPSIRTYNARMYEAKFLLGVIAGAMTENGKVGYIAQAPTYGEIANINGFAIGAKLVNPQVKVYLDWFGIAGNDPDQNLSQQGVSLISGKDWITPGLNDRHFGLYDRRSDKKNLAMAVLDWGSLYVKMTRSILDGSWKEEEAKNRKAINYWWGISAGVVDIICGSAIPQSVKQLVSFLKRGIAADVINPFSGILYSQQGQITETEDASLTPEQILQIDWLLDNVVGSIPEFTTLDPIDQLVMRLQGLDPLSDNTVKQKAAGLKSEEGKTL